ncbi:beta-glucosidase-like protein [Neohortaea acidophila]|uniref:beta-glucosidase n=1 Tax=Neohortaea acidophila TaxID=245834 RepID=A0A6A6PHR6_9PEZI|nr:beta-glucosidase-like protein [Neohortaea acidophila]KAF2479522.1 beta-glucosidase-like protein [Neohortaea acidophila]
MALTPPESYELEQSHDPLMTRDSSDHDSLTSDIDDFDPLDDHEKSYRDDASQPLQRPRRKGRWRKWLIPSRFCCILIALFFTTLFLLLSVGGFWVYTASVPSYGESPPWYPSPQGGTVSTWKDAYEKAAALVGQMTLVEKVNITTGTGWSMGMCVGNTGPVERLGFPSLCLQDGPLGLRFVDNATAWPAGITVGATWSKPLMFLRGKAHGFEAKKKGINVLLGPSMGPIGRLPAGGRNWEGFGSDPVLQGISAAQTIKGIQNVGVMATAKHFVGNEQEHFRQAWEWNTPNAISSNIDDRTLHELYAWPFAEAVRAGVASVMCSYNQVNNSYACQNSKLLNGILKDELGFQGFVMSDWVAQRSGVASALAGLDMTMPGDGLHHQDGNSLWGTELTKAVLNSSVPMQRLNDMTMRVVAAWYQTQQDSHSQWPPVSAGGGPTFSSWTNEKVGNLHPGSPDSSDTGIVNKFVPVRNTPEDGDHDALARRIATEGIVMVKNTDGFLPVSKTGSGLTSKDGYGIVKVGIFGEDAYPNPDGINNCVDRACNVGTLTMGWGSGAVELPYLSPPAFTLRRIMEEDKYNITDWADNHKPGIEQAAKEQDVCFVFISSDAGEGYLGWEDVKGDRNELYAQKGGDEMVRRVASNCEKTVVVLHTVGPTILERWIDLPGVKAVLIAHLPGQEAGQAIVDVIFGEANPSGRLPYTIAKKPEDYGPTSEVMYLPNAVVPQQNFTEGLYIDYRYFDKHDIDPRYEFGYGLSYGGFKLNSLMVHPLGSANHEALPRPDALKPPQLDTTIPSVDSALWPQGMRKLKKYIYPYIDSVSDIKHGKYPYPNGYDTPQAVSKAGGGEGGNHDLFNTAVNVRAELTNLGTMDGFCVVQLYLEFPPNIVDADGEPVDMPVRVLRNFDKIWTEGSHKRTRISMDLTRKDLSYWDVKRQTWIMPDGEFRVHLGFSSRDLPLSMPGMIVI